MDSKYIRRKHVAESDVDPVGQATRENLEPILRLVDNFKETIRKSKNLAGETEEFLNKLVEKLRAAVAEIIAEIEDVESALKRTGGEIAEMLDTHLYSETIPEQLEEIKAAIKKQRDSVVKAVAEIEKQLKISPGTGNVNDRLSAILEHLSSDKMNKETRESLGRIIETHVLECPDAELREKLKNLCYLLKSRSFADLLDLEIRL